MRLTNLREVTSTKAATGALDKFLAHKPTQPTPVAAAADVNKADINTPVVPGRTATGAMDRFLSHKPTSDVNTADVVEDDVDVVVDEVAATCPVCGRGVPGANTELNKHIDECLNAQTIHDLVQSVRHT